MDALSLNDYIVLGGCVAWCVFAWLVLTDRININIF